LGPLFGQKPQNLPSYSLCLSSIFLGRTIGQGKDNKKKENNKEKREKFGGFRKRNRKETGWKTCTSCTDY
jgi:hypothetical protein